MALRGLVPPLPDAWAREWQLSAGSDAAFIKTGYSAQRSGSVFGAADALEAAVKELEEEMVRWDVAEAKVAADRRAAVARAHKEAAEAEATKAAARLAAWQSFLGQPSGDANDRASSTSTSSPRGSSETAEEGAEELSLLPKIGFGRGGSDGGLHMHKRSQQQFGGYGRKGVLGVLAYWKRIFTLHGDYRK